MTKEELLPRGEQYFADPTITSMYATSDGNFFYSHSSNHAQAHKREKGLELYVITREDYGPKAIATAEIADPPKLEYTDDQIANYEEENPGKNAEWNEKPTKKFKEWLDGVT